MADNSKDVFVVHGHDDNMRLEVTSALVKLGLNPIVLFDEADKGRTIIEKFEEHSDVAFAVVLMSPDDQVRKKNAKGRWQKGDMRARQNVIFELGFFRAKLKKDKVLVFKKGDLEILTDFAGVLYAPFVSGWEMKLVKELQAAGFDVDANDIVGSGRSKKKLAALNNTILPLDYVVASEQNHLASSENIEYEASQLPSEHLYGHGVATDIFLQQARGFADTRMKTTGSNADDSKEVSATFVMGGPVQVDYSQRGYKLPAILGHNAYRIKMLDGRERDIDSSMCNDIGIRLAAGDLKKLPELSQRGGWATPYSSPHVPLSVYMYREPAAMARYLLLDKTKGLGIELRSDDLESIRHVK